LSLVLPAYNEEERLPAFLHSVRRYLDHDCENTYEVIIVDDGSRQPLAIVLRDLVSSWPRLRIIRHPRNWGRGLAVRTGIRATKGSLILVSDSDGACPIEQERDLAKPLSEGAEVAIASRIVFARSAVRERLWYRALLGRSFALLARKCLGLSVFDTQCGFKLFRREAALVLCELCSETGFLFDVELLWWAERLGYRIAEIPVTWREMPGSKVRLFKDGARMLYGLARMRQLLGKANGRPRSSTRRGQARPAQERFCIEA